MFMKLPQIVDFDRAVVQPHALQPGADPRRAPKVKGGLVDQIENSVHLRTVLLVVCLRSGFGRTSAVSFPVRPCHQTPKQCADRPAPITRTAGLRRSANAPQAGGTVPGVRPRPAGPRGLVPA